MAGRYHCLGARGLGAHVSSWGVVGALGLIASMDVSGTEKTVLSGTQQPERRVGRGADDLLANPVRVHLRKARWIGHK